MRPDLLEPYEHSLRTREPLALVDVRGRTLTFDTLRWLGRADAVDRAVVDRCTGPVLDLGCGPGRIVSALIRSGVPALGVDFASAAVGLARDRGAPVLQRDLFGPLPGEGRWPTVLLLDGNVGIGGDVGRMLDRVRTLLAPGGRLIVEAEAECCDETLTVRFHRRGQPVGEAFSWARIGPVALRSRAVRAGLHTTHAWHGGGRNFLELQAA